MSLVRFSVAPHETLVDAFYGGLLCLCHVVVFVPLDLFRHESFPRLSACSPTPPGFSCHVVHFVPRKRFKWYGACFHGRFVPRKRFKWYRVFFRMRFVPRKRFNLHQMCVSSPVPSTSSLLGFPLTKSRAY